MNIIEELEWRGLIKDCTDKELLKKLVEEHATVYCGYDPTAASLHIGHLVPVLTLRRLQQAGLRVIALVGAGTGLIGDPSGRKSERQLLTLEQSRINAEGLKSQLGRYLDFSDPKKTLMVSNYDWLKDINVISFLRDYGKNFSINYMLAKDVVASRLEAGISYTEFSYMLLQSIDFLHLYQEEHCQIEMGGSDQWGNITAGVEMIRKVTGNSDVCGFVLPLITKADGTKFGKSAGGAFWLDRNLTSPYQIYQYFLNSADSEVIHYLKVFTFLTREEIEALEVKVSEHPEFREAQKVLAYEVVKLMHSKEDADDCVKMSEVLFGGNVKDLTLDQIELCFEGVPSLTVSEGDSLVDKLIEIKACSSKRDARELISKGTFSLNGEKTTDTYLTLTKDLAIDGKVIVVRKGKKKYFLFRF